MKNDGGMWKAAEREKVSESTEGNKDCRVDVGGIMTLPVRWPGRSTTAGLSLRRN